MGLDHLYAPLQRCPVPLVFEIVVPDVDFETASGRIRSFDPVPEAEIYIFNMVLPNTVFEKRWVQMQRFRDIVANKYPQVHVEQMHKVDSIEEFDTFYEKALERGEEGACWISPNHIYNPGTRQWQWMKRIPFISIEVEVKSILPGTKGKKYENSLGRMECQLPNGDIVRVGIFKGQTDEWRQYIYKNRDAYIGRVATIIFKNYSKYGIPVQPRFVAFRWDI